jgi:5-methylcytosine-specific restriction protein A
MRWLTTAGLATASGFLLYRLFSGAGRGETLEALERRFASTLESLLAQARKAGETFLEVNAGDLHRKVGGFPGPQHHMSLCCNVLRGAMGPDDFAVREPRSGSGPSLTLRYHLIEAA